MPEYVYPRNLILGSKEHALYFTYIVSIDYMTDAEKLWKRAGSKLCTKRKCKQCPIENLCNKTKGITFKGNIIIWSMNKA